MYRRDRRANAQTRGLQGSRPQHANTEQVANVLEVRVRAVWLPVASEVPRGRVQHRREQDQRCQLTVALAATVLAPGNTGDIVVEIPQREAAMNANLLNV